MTAAAKCQEGDGRRARTCISAKRMRRASIASADSEEPTAAEAAGVAASPSAPGGAAAARARVSSSEVACSRATSMWRRRRRFSRLRWHASVKWLHHHRQGGGGLDCRRHSSGKRTAHAPVQVVKVGLEDVEGELRVAVGAARHLLHRHDAVCRVAAAERGECPPPLPPPLAPPSSPETRRKSSSLASLAGMRACSASAFSSRPPCCQWRRGGGEGRKEGMGAGREQQQPGQRWGRAAAHDEEEVDHAR